MPNFRLSRKLEVLCMSDNSIVNQANANQFGINVECVSSIVKAQSTLDSFETSAPLRKNLTLVDKLRV